MSNHAPPTFETMRRQRVLVAGLIGVAFASLALWRQRETHGVNWDYVEPC